MSAERKLAALSPEARKAALTALDEISRPLTPRELDELLQPILSRSIRRPVSRALASLDVIAIRPRP